MTYRGWTAEKSGETTGSVVTRCRQCRHHHVDTEGDCRCDVEREELVRTWLNTREGDEVIACVNQAPTMCPLYREVGRD